MSETINHPIAHALDMLHGIQRRNPLLRWSLNVTDAGRYWTIDIKLGDRLAALQGRDYPSLARNALTWVETECDRLDRLESA